jgi:hypothetical protein
MRYPSPTPRNRGFTVDNKISRFLIARQAKIQAFPKAKQVGEVEQTSRTNNATSTRDLRTHYVIQIYEGKKYCSWSPPLVLTRSGTDACNTIDMICCESMAGKCRNNDGVYSVPYVWLSSGFGRSSQRP